jgi:chemotaxis protein CheY-P-specific phosphatase CheC
VLAFQTRLNLALQDAAEIVNDVIQTSVIATPAAFLLRDVQLIPYEELVRRTEPERQFRASIVTSHISARTGVVIGKAMLIFSSDRAAKLALLMLSDETSGTDMDALRNSVYLELGNILLNSILETLATHRPGDRYSTPTYSEIISDELFSPRLMMSDEIMAAAAVDCIVETHTIHGQMMMSLKQDIWHSALAAISNELKSNEAK